MTNEEAIEILLDMRKGSASCLAAEHPNNKEDVKEWTNEINAIDTMINNYNREKARADKLEKDYSKSLTKIDELESDNYECNNIIVRYMEELEFKDKMIEMYIEHIYRSCDFDNRIKTKEQIKQFFENLAKESGDIDDKRI